MNQSVFVTLSNSYPCGNTGFETVIQKNIKVYIETDANKIRLVFWFAVHMNLKVHLASFDALFFKNYTKFLFLIGILHISMPSRYIPMYITDFWENTEKTY